MYDKNPRRFRLNVSPTGTPPKYVWGCYFPESDLCVTQDGSRGTGLPPKVEWLDDPSTLPWCKVTVKMVPRGTVQA